MQYLVRIPVSEASPQALFGLDEIIADLPPTKVVREFFRAQSEGINDREEDRALGSAVAEKAPTRRGRNPLKKAGAGKRE